MRKKQSIRKTPLISKTTLALFAKAVYKGSMQFTIAGEQNEAYFEGSTEFTGDFVNERVRAEILAFPRLYSFNIKLRDENGVLVDDVDCDMPDDYLTVDEVKILATDLTKQIINECEADIVDLSKSTLKIELLQTKGK